VKKMTFSSDLQELYFHLEHTQSGDRYIAWYGQLRAMGWDHPNALQCTIDHFHLTEQDWYQRRIK
jgi:hypothetical protein